MNEPSEGRILGWIMAQVRIAIPEFYFWRANRGAMQTKSGYVEFGAVGQSDILGVLYGRFIAIEVKSKTGRQSTDQCAFQEKIESAGGVYIIARTPADVISTLRKLIS